MIVVSAVQVESITFQYKEQDEESPFFWHAVTYQREAPDQPWQWAFGDEQERWPETITDKEATLIKLGRDPRSPQQLGAIKEYAINVNDAELNDRFLKINSFIDGHVSKAGITEEFFDSVEIGKIHKWLKQHIRER